MVIAYTAWLCPPNVILKQWETKYLQNIGTFIDNRCGFNCWWIKNTVWPMNINQLSSQWLIQFKKFSLLGVKILSAYILLPQQWLLEAQDSFYNRWQECALAWEQILFNFSVLIRAEKRYSFAPTKFSWMGTLGLV